MRVESVTTVGFSIVNISLTRWPASLGDCPAFSLLHWSCCSNWWPRSEWSRCASHLSPDSSHSPDWASHHSDSLPDQSHQLHWYPTIRAQTLFSSNTFNCFPVCKMGPQLSLNNFPHSKSRSLSVTKHFTHCTCRTNPLRADLSPWWPYNIWEHLSLFYDTSQVPHNDANHENATINEDLLLFSFESDDSIS